ncbi:MAG: MerR family transcriptional regulator [Gammaproteobacteria bacterium]|nr:MerR family transcriptional regulator [Gammaproteobacteria bacterium]
MHTNNDILRGEILDEEVMLTLGELSRACTIHADWIIDLVDEGIIEPRGREVSEWRFPGICLYRVRSVMRLQRDLGVNLAGAAVALDLMDQIEQLRTHLRVLDHDW